MTNKNEQIKASTNTKDDEYSHLLSIANKLEAIQSNSESVIDLFATPAVKLYANLCNDCVKLFSRRIDRFRLDDYRKAEELIWKRVYHDIYRNQKPRRQRVKKQDNLLMESHFLAGIGFYSNMIILLRLRYNILNTVGLPDSLNLTLGPIDSFSENIRLNANVDQSKHDFDHNQITSDDSDATLGLASEWARQAIYRSLVYMGDLSRYLHEISQVDYRYLSSYFYKCAFHYQPDKGLPFNQLATLSMSNNTNHNLSAITNFMRCCLRKKPFEGAEINMKKIFELNEKILEQERCNSVMKASEVLSSKDPGSSAESLVRSTIVKFIGLTSDLWNSTSDKSNQVPKIGLTDKLLSFFENLREALELIPIVPVATPTRYEESFQPVSVGDSSSEKPKYISPTIMYEFCSISLMLLARCCKSKSSDYADFVYQDPIISSVNTLCLNLLHYSTSKCQKMIVSKIQDLRVLQQEIALTRIDNEIANSEDDRFMKSALAHVYTKTFLPTVKILCDWLLSNGDIIASNLQSFCSFYSELGELVSLLTELKRVAETLDKLAINGDTDSNCHPILNSNNSNSSELYRHKFDGPNWKQKYPISCDYPLLDIEPLKNVHQLNIDFSYLKRLDDTEAGFLTIECLIAFFNVLKIFLENKQSQ